MRRPESYSTKHGEAILAYLVAMKDSFVTAAQIAEHLRGERVPISRPTVYRQLEKLIGSGKVHKYFFGDASVASFRYVGADESARDHYRLKCGVCDGIFDIECGELGQVARHILESHAFQVDDTIFYGKCKSCLKI